jgi:hypothetical protein
MRREMAVKATLQVMAKGDGTDGIAAGQRAATAIIMPR